jgi:arylsulfatase A
MIKIQSPLPVLGALLALGAMPAPAQEKPLNVVFILADDLGFGEVGCYGQTKIPTPNLDRLAASGMRFTDHHSGAPVCAPSRCVLMTGLHLGHAEVRGNRAMAKVAPDLYSEGQHPLAETTFTMAMAFKRAGYTTGAMGKWGLGPVNSTGAPHRKGFDHFFGYNCQSVAHSFYPPHLWRNEEKITVNASPIPGHARQPEGEVRLEDWIGETYAPKLMIAEAETFIDDNKDRPFFLYLPFIEPHVAMHPPKESVERFPADWDDQVYRGENGYLPHPRPRAGYAAMISDLDSYVGRVLDRLENHGLTSRTLVIFSSDNGTTLPRNEGARFHVGGVDGSFFNSTADLRGWKGSVYEGGIRVPTIASLPGKIPAGTVNPSPSYFADWFPTLCEATGMPVPAGLDGESLWDSMLSGQPRPPRQRPMVYVFPEYGGQVAVRLGMMKVVRQNLKTKNPGPWEVYDLEADPGESRDLSAQRQDVIDQAIAILREQTRENPVFDVPLHLP